MRRKSDSRATAILAFPIFVPDHTWIEGGKNETGARLKPNMTRRPTDPRAAAEAAFRPAAKVAPPAPKPAVIPGAREQVTLRIDQDVLEVFQEDGAGWQDRINAALRESVAAKLFARTEQGSIPVERLCGENDDGAG